MPAPGEGSSQVAKMPGRRQESNLKIRAAQGTMGLPRNAIIVAGTVKEAPFHKESALDCLLMARAIENT